MADIAEKLHLILKNQNEIKDRVSKVEDTLNEISLRIAANEIRLSTVEDVQAQLQNSVFELQAKVKNLELENMK